MSKTEQGLETIDIKGKEYVQVNQRILYFWQKYTNWSLVTSWIECNLNVAIGRAEAIDENGVVRASGTAMEVKDNGFINKFSHIENCETSAVGRCLGNLGIGIDVSVASYEEVANAIKNQEKESPQRVTKGTKKFKPEPTVESALARIKKGYQALNYSDEKQDELNLKYTGFVFLNDCGDLEKLNTLLEELVNQAIKAGSK